MTDDRWADAMRDALALIQLFLDAGSERQPDQADYEAIMRNGNPADIAASAALACAGFLTELDRRGLVDSRQAIAEMQRMYAAGRPDV
jgi:hypothetical protein